jgi:hypothetical protein
VLTSGCISSGTVSPAQPSWSPLLVDTSNLPTGYTTKLSTFTLTGFPLPTVVNGYAYIPTASISAVASNSHATCSTGSPCSGILVYSGH